MWHTQNDLLSDCFIYLTLISHIMGEPKSWGWKISFGVSIGAIVFSFYPFYMIIEEPMFASEWIAFGFLIIILGSIPLLVFEFKDRKLRKTQSGAGSLQRRPLSGGGIAVMLVVIIGFIVVVIMAGTASTAEEAGIARISKAILLLFLLVLGLFGGLRNREEVGREKED